MKNLGKVNDPKDITTKEYVDKVTGDLDKTKLNEKDLSEMTAEEVESLWNQIFTTQSSNK